jgi:hypothetical protein
MKDPVFIDGAAEDLVALFFIDRHALAAEHRLVNGRLPVGNGAIGRDTLSGPDQQQIARLYLGGRHGPLTAVFQQGGGVGGQFHELDDGVRGVRFRPRFHIFAEGNQGDQHPRRLEIEVHGPHVRIDIEGDLDEIPGRIDERRPGADGDEGIHVGIFAQQGRDADQVKTPPQPHDGQHEEELQQGEIEGMAMRADDFRQGQTRHFAHGDIEERYNQAERPGQAPFHGGELLLLFRLFFGKLAGLTGRHPGLETQVGDGFTDLPQAALVFPIDDPRRFRRQIDFGSTDTGELPDHIFDAGRAGRAVHAADREGLADLLFRYRFGQFETEIFHPFRHGREGETALVPDQVHGLRRQVHGNAGYPRHPRNHLLDTAGTGCTVHPLHRNIDPPVMA